MFFKKKKGKTPKTSNRKVVPNMKPIEELRTNKDVAEWCRDFLRISLKASLTSRLIDFKYLREAEAPAYTHGVSNDTFDYEFDDDDDDIPAFSVPEA